MACPANRKPVGKKCPDDWPFYRSMNDGETMCCYKYTRDTSYIGKKHSTQLKGRLTRIRNLKVDIIDTEVKLSNSKRKALTLSKKLKIALQKLIASYGNNKVDSVVDNLEQNLKHDQANLNNLNQQLQDQLKKCREEYIAAKQDVATSNEKNQITEQKLAEIEAIYQKKLDELKRLVDKQRDEIASHIAKMSQMSDKIIQTDVGMRELSDLQEQLQKLNLERIDLINRLGDKDLKLNELDKAKRLCDESIGKNRERLERLEDEIRNLDQKYRQEKVESDVVIQDLKVKLDEVEKERDKLREEAKRTTDNSRLKERISELDDEVNQKRVEISALQRLNQEFENKLRMCTEDKSNVEKRLSDMIENYNRSLADLQRLNSTISRLETEVERLRRTPAVGDKELVELRAERDSLLLERDQLRARLKDMIDPSQRQKLESDLEDKNNQIANLNREIESLRKDLQELNQRVRELEASLANQSKLQQEIELLRRTIAEITKDRDENLKKLNETLENMKALQAQLTGTDRLAIDITTVRQQLEDERRERQRLEAELTSLRSELDSERLLTTNLKTTNQTLQSEVDQLKTELEALKRLQLEKDVTTEKDASEVSRLRSQLEQLEREKQDLVSEVDRLRAENTDRLSVITDLQGQLKAFEGITPQSYRDAQEQVSRLTQDNSRLTRELSDLQLKHERVLKDLETLRQQLVDETRKLRPSEDRIAELTSKLAELTRIRGELEAQLLTIKDSLRDSEARNSDLNQKVVDLTQENDRLNTEMQTLRESVSAEEKLLRDEITALKKQLSDKSLTEADVAQLKEQLRLMQDMKSQLEAKLREMDELVKRVSKLEKELQTCQEHEIAGKDVSMKVTELEAKLRDMTSQRDKLEADLNQIRELLSQAQAKNVGYETTIDQLRQENSKLNSEIDSLRSQFETEKRALQDEIVTLKKQLGDKSLTEAEVAQLKEQLRLMQDMKSELEAKFSLFEARVSELETELKQCREREAAEKDTSAQVEVLRQQLDEVSKQKESLVIELSQIREQLSQAKNKNIEHEATIERLTQDKSRLAEELESLRKKLDSENQTLRDQISTLQQQLKENESLSKTEIDRLKKEIRELEQVRSDLNTKIALINNLEGKILRLESDLRTCQEKESSGKDVATQVEVLSQKLAEMTRQKETLEKDWQIKHSAQEATIGQLRQENAGLVAEIGTLKSGLGAERKRLTDELTGLKEQLRVSDLTRQERDQLRIEKSTLETRLRELDSLRAQINRLQAELKTCLEEKERTGRDNVQKLAQLDGQVKDLQEKLRQKFETVAHEEVERRSQEELRLRLKTAELKLEANVIGRYELTTEPPVDRIQAIGEKLGKQGITTVSDLIELYCNYITQKLLTPAMVKISSFSLTEIREILEDDKVRLNIDKKDLARVLPEYLYIDIKNVRDVNRPYYANHFQPIQEYIDRDTINVTTFDTNKSGLYVFVGRYCKKLLESLSDTDLSASEMRTTMSYYLIDNVESVLRFGKLEADLNSPDNVNFRNILDNKLREKVSGNVLTYLKIRNDDGTEWNRRFQVGINDQNKSLLIKYNSHNIPYYEGNRNLAKEDLDKNLRSIGLEDKTGHYPSNFDRTGAPSKYDHTYVIGPLTDVYPQNVSNREIANKLTNIITNLENQIPVFIIGYGASGAGKTSTLIYLKNGEQEGILVHLCNLMATKGYTKLTMKAYEFYRKVGETKTTTRETRDMNFTHTGTSFYLDKNYIHENTFSQEPVKEFTTANKMSEVMIYLIDEDRYVKATTNNPNSSRSHALVFVELRSEDKVSQLVVGDFAGVENIFNCDNDDVIGRFLNVKRGDGKRFYSDFKSPGDRNYEYTKETCRDDINKDEDLYIFSAKTPIRGKERYNPYYQSNYHTVMKRLAEVALQVTGSRSEGDVFERVKRDIRNWSIVDERVANDVKVAKAILNSFSDAMLKPPKGSNRELEIKKVLYKTVLKTLGLEYAYTRDLVTDDVITAFEADLVAIPKGAENINILVQKLQIKSLVPDMSGVVKKKLLEQRDIIKRIYTSKSSYMSSFLNGEIPSDSFKELKICGGKGNVLTQYSGNPLGEIKAKEYRQNIKAFDAWSTIKCDNISNSQKFIDAWYKLFTENTVLSTLVTGLTEGQNPFPVIWSRLSELYGEAEKPSVNFSDIIDLKNYTSVYNDLKSLVVETNCRMDYGKTVCEIRRNEGYMINDSLRTVRNTIRKILIEKNKNNINISPAFVDACLDMYCSDKGCFDLGESKDDSDLIFDVIRKNLRDNYSRLVVGVFCVLNLSKSANNPPPVPYIDVNSLWYRVNKFSPDTFIRGLNAKKNETEFYKRAKSVIKTITSMSDKVSDLIASTEFETFQKVVNDIEKGTLTVEDHRNITGFLEYVDKINAASAIGTIQFVDSLAKYNSVKALCDLEESDIAHRQVQFTYKNIVTKDTLSR